MWRRFFHHGSVSITYYTVERDDVGFKLRHRRSRAACGETSEEPTRIQPGPHGGFASFGSTSTLVCKDIPQICNPLPTEAGQ